MEKFKERANWIVIAFLAILYVAMGMMTFENGALTINDFSTYTWLDWTLWAVFTFVPAAMALVVDTTFNKEGIRQGELKIKEQIDEYRKYLHVDITRIFRSKKQYLAEGTIKSGSKKFLTALVLSFVAGQMFFDLSADGILKIAINLSMWGVYGVMAFNKSNEYALDELKEWYIVEAAKLKKIDDEEKEVVRVEREAALAKQKEELEEASKGETYRLKKDLKLWKEVTRYVNGKIPEL